MESLKLRPVFHRNLECIAITGKCAPEILAKIKTIKDARWSRAYRSWYIPFEERAAEIINGKLAGLAEVEDSILQEYIAKRKRLESIGYNITDTTIRMFAVSLHNLSQ